MRDIVWEFDDEKEAADFLDRKYREYRLGEKKQCAPANRLALIEFKTDSGTRWQVRMQLVPGVPSMLVAKAIVAAWHFRINCGVDDHIKSCYLA